MLTSRQRPRRRYTIFSDNHLLSFFCAAFGVIITVWFRHGGFGALFDGATPAATSLTQLSGIAASFLQVWRVWRWPVGRWPSRSMASWFGATNSGLIPSCINTTTMWHLKRARVW